MCWGRGVILKTMSFKLRLDFKQTVLFDISLQKKILTLVNCKKLTLYTATVKTQGFESSKEGRPLVDKVSIIQVQVCLIASYLKYSFKFSNGPRESNKNK